MGLLDDLDARRDRREVETENRARLAHAHAVFQTVGLGSIQNPKRVDFGLVFVEKPIAAYACETDLDDLLDQMQGSQYNDVGSLPLPMTSGHVVQWDQDDRDFYCGAWLAVRVHFPSEDTFGYTKPSPTILHHFSFSAIAMKEIPIDNSDSVE